MIACFGATELGCVLNYLGLSPKNILNRLKFIEDENIYFG
jgi:predicted transcriptional regulator